MTAATLKVGDLAKRTGVSVRTLHYYDEIGLLQPSHYTGVGYRLYGKDEVVRLQQIKSLQQLGFTLDEIREFMTTPGFSPVEVLEMHMQRVKQQIKLQQVVYGRLDGLARALKATGKATMEDFLDVIEVINNMESEFTPEQMQEIRERGEQLGREHITQVEQEWPVLIEKVRVELDAGTPPSDPKVVALARRWKQLVQEFSGGNPEIEKVLRKKYQKDPSQGGRLDPRMLEYMEYIQKAWDSEEG